MVSDTLGDLNQFAESGTVVPGQVGQGLTVDLDIGFVQTIDEFAVGHFVQTAGSVYADDPEPAELSLFLFAVSKSEGHATLNGLAGKAIGVSAG